MRMKRAVVSATIVAALVTGAAGCVAGKDKAGGSGPPLVLKIANSSAHLDYEPGVAYFIRRIEELSAGKLRIEVKHKWGDFQPDAEQSVVRDVAAGKADLAWVGTRIFDTLGVTDFQALTAPMLIDNYPLQNAVVESAIPAEMLKSLDKLRITGLGVLADGLRKPIAVERPLLGPADWRGITFAAFRSAGQADAVRALGAHPAEDFGPPLDTALDERRVDGFEKNLLTYQINGMARRAPYVTANVNLWPQTVVLFAGSGRFDKLTGAQRDWLRRAAKDATAWSTGVGDHDAQIATELCSSGARFANASEADLAALHQAFTPVYTKLAQDRQTKTFIQQIEQLKQATAAGVPVAIPAGCTGPATVGPTPPASSAVQGLDGTYRWTLTKQDALAHGGPRDKTADGLAQYPMTFTNTLHDGTWSGGDANGTYTVEGDRITFSWPHEALALAFYYTRDAAGNLRLRPAGPMDVGDQFVWCTRVWTKIG